MWVYFKQGVLIMLKSFGYSKNGAIFKWEGEIMFNSYLNNDTRRKVFISYYHGDQEAVNKFVRDFGDVFIPKTVGVRDGDFYFDSNKLYIFFI